MPLSLSMEAQSGNAKNKKFEKFRIVLPQFLACTATNLILLELAMACQFSTIVIPVLLESTNGLKFTKEQASWFGSIIFICQPVGSIVSGFTSQAWGRKRNLIFVNFPFILAWFLMYSASNLYQMFTATIILGLAIGFTEAPFVNYIGEMSQPKWRGALIQYSQIYYSSGFFLMSLIGTLTDWHTTAAIASSVPMLAIISIVLLPESPAWLLFKGREDDSRKSLCWLRGWVKPEEIKEEFQELVQCNKTLHEHKESSPSIFYGLLKNDILRPLLLVNIFFIFDHMAGITGTRPFMIQIFKEFGSPIDPFWATVIESAVGILANLIGCLTIAKMGKRGICHVSFLGCATCCILISIYGFFFLKTTTSWIPVTLYFIFNFTWAIGIGMVPWILLSEIFPIRGRSVASGVSSAFAYLVSFLATKTYYDLTSAFTLAGAFAVYGLTTIIGWVFFCFCIPETEGKPLEEVQMIYSNVGRRENYQNRLDKDSVSF